MNQRRPWLFRPVDLRGSRLPSRLIASPTCQCATVDDLDTAHRLVPASQLEGRSRNGLDVSAGDPGPVQQVCGGASADLGARQV